MLTGIVCLVSIVLFAGINLDPGPIDWVIYKKWGAPSSVDVFNGSYWGLISSNFLHTELWHIGFNLYWIWVFGKKIEHESTKGSYALLILTSALVSSAAQLSFADSTGIGLSGIGYSFFGFILIKGRTSGAYKNAIDKRTTNLFLFWLALCIVLSYADLWAVGNAAHVCGLLWGITVAYLSALQRIKQIIFGLLLLAFITSMIFWTPFGVSYLSHRAYQLHREHQYDEAAELYKKILDRKADNGFATENLRLIQIHELSNKAFKLHSNGKYKEAREVYQQLLEMDSTYEWAKENIQRLPAE